MPAVIVLPPKFLEFLKWYQHKVMKTLEDVWICSYAFIAVVVLNVGIPRTAQGTELGSSFWDVLSRSDQPNPDAFRNFLLMVLSVAYCALAIWIASSTSLSNATQNAGKPYKARESGSTLPFWFAFLVVLSVVGLVTGNPVFHLFGGWNVDLATLLNIFAIVVLLAIPFFPRDLSGMKNTPPALKGLRHTAHTAHKYLSHWRTEYEVALTAIGVATFLATYFNQVDFPRFLTTWVLIYVAMGFWPLWGSRVFIAWPRLHGWPSFWLLPIALGLLFSNWNDNHEISQANFGPPPPAMPSLEKAISNWHRDKNCSQAQPCEMRIVAAEGGGLRAAYWTAKILQLLDEHQAADAKGDPTHASFSQSVFAVSTISGGSLGTVAYYESQLVKGGSCNPDDFLFQYLGDDHLSPVIASFAFGNAFQWIWPFRIGSVDRAKAFEANMSERWRVALDDAKCPTATRNVFDAPYSPVTFAPDASEPYIPFMFMNSTNVEAGKRFIFATSAQPDLDVRRDQVQDIYALDTYWAFDPKSKLGLQAIPVRTAVRLSASFPLVTPAGTFYEHPATAAYNRGRLWGRLVDGGYFDGTGLTTAYDISDEVQRIFPKGDIHVTVVYISNDPATSAGWVDARDAVPAPPDPPATLLITSNSENKTEELSKTSVPAYPPWLYEIEGIAAGGLSSHFEGAIESARRRMSELEAGQHVKRQDQCLSILYHKGDAVPKSGLCEISFGEILRNVNDPRPALGWWLSRKSQDEMNDASKCYIDVLDRRSANVERELAACDVKGASS